jgi:hypothetical protein
MSGAQSVAFQDMSLEMAAQGWLWTEHYIVELLITEAHAPAK